MTVAGRVGSGTGEARDGKATATCILDMLRGNSVSGGLLFGCQLETWQETIQYANGEATGYIWNFDKCILKQCKLINIRESISSSKDYYKIANIYIKFNSLLYKYLLSLHHVMQKENNVATLTEWTYREKGGLRLRVFRYRQNQLLLS